MPIRNLVVLATLLAAQVTLAATSPPVVDAAVTRALSVESRVRVIVSFDAGAARGDDARLKRQVREGAGQLLDVLDAEHVVVRHRYRRVPALALELDAQALKALERHPSVTGIELDVGGAGHMVQASPLVHLNETFSAGLTGAGAKVAVIDSGIDTDHRDFSGRIVAQQCFCAGLPGSEGCCPNGADVMSGDGSAEDDHGHGTNVSGILAGGGKVAHRGAAPEASIVAVKVLDDKNRFCCSSDVVAALDWVLEQHPDASVVNASLGTSALFSGECDASTGYTRALGTAVDNLVQNGTMVFVSSGNSGSSTSLSAPACNRGVIAVGAVWDADIGERLVLGCNDNAVEDKATCFTNSNDQVDLYAPGAPITSSGRNGGTSTFSGTSQATPMVAGCAASLRAEWPEASADEIETALKTSPVRITDAKSGLQFPRLDCSAAALWLSGALFGNGFER